MPRRSTCFLRGRDEVAVNRPAQRTWDQAEEARKVSARNGEDLARAGGAHVRHRGLVREEAHLALSRYPGPDERVTSPADYR